MRREKVLKICLNHALTPDIDYHSKDDKTWLFVAADFSDGEISRQQFCLRFKTAEIAQEFKKAVNEALKKISGKIKVDLKCQWIVYSACTVFAFAGIFFILKRSSPPVLPR